MHLNVGVVLPERIRKDIAVPDWPQFLRGCLKYREALDRELRDAPRTGAEFDETGDRSEPAAREPNRRA